MTSSNIIFTPESNPELFLPTEPFEGPLKAFLKTLKKNPAYPESMFEALHRLVLRLGINQDNTELVRRLTGKEGIVSFNAYADLFGMDEAIFEFVTGYVLAGAEGGRPSRKMALFYGEPGCAKSSFVDRTIEILQTREPAPVLGGSRTWNNPLDALYMAKKIAAKKSGRRPAQQLKELITIVEQLELEGESALDFESDEVVAVTAKYGKSGRELTPQDLAEICMKSEKDFVRTICFGLGLSRPTVDALGYPDAYAQDVVLGEFFGKEGIDCKDSMPVGKNMKDKMYGKFDEDYALPLAEWPIHNMFMSEGEGIVSVTEMQPINFDLKDLRGERNYTGEGIYSDRDPRIVKLNGYCSKGKFLEFVEDGRNPQESHRAKLEMLESHINQYPDPLDPHHPEGVHWSGMMISHNNKELWNRFYGDLLNRAYIDRYVPIKVAFPLRYEDNAKVTEKLIKMTKFGRPQEKGGVHFEPFLYTLAGMFRTASHIDWASKGYRTFKAVLKAYNGEETRERLQGTVIDPVAMRAQASPEEGMKGIGPRELDTILCALSAVALSHSRTKSDRKACVTLNDLLYGTIEAIKANPTLDKKMKESCIASLEGPLNEIVRDQKRHIYKAAFVSQFNDYCQQLFRQYLVYSRCLSLGTRPSGDGIISNVTQYDMQDFLQKIERADEVEINSAQADKFRKAVTEAVNLYNEEHKTTNPPYTCHAGLAACIEAYALNKAKDIVGFAGISNLSDEEKARLSEAKSRLIVEHKYCDYCATQLINTSSEFLKK